MGIQWLTLSRNYALYLTHTLRLTHNEIAKITPPAEKKPRRISGIILSMGSANGILRNNYPWKMLSELVSGMFGVFYDLYAFHPFSNWREFDWILKYRDFKKYIRCII